MLFSYNVYEGILVNYLEILLKNIEGSMKKIKGESLKEIESSTHYDGCTFYLDKVYDIENSVFDNCSFRTKVTFSGLAGCEFINCGFSAEFILDFECKEEMEEIPAYVFGLKDLTSLNLFEQPIARIPPEIGKLENLTSLITNLDTDYIPVEICQLTKLKSLSLTHGQLNSLPPEFANLKQLSSLDLEGNRFTEVPAVLAELPLESLFLNWNAIRKFSAQVAVKMHSLRDLYLPMNEMPEIPEGVFELKNLTILNFYSNNIREIPQEIVKLENLEHLNFSRNEINDIPAELWQLQKLRSLDFGGNNLSSVSPDIARLHKLNSLSVSNNQLQNLPQEIQGLPLEVINVGRNNIDVDLIQSWFPKCRVDDY